MDQETPTDKLLDACGARKSGTKPGQDQESKKYYQALLDRAENASASAHQAQDETDKAYRRLTAYVREELPKHLVRAFEEVARNEIGDRLRPLDNQIRNAVAEVDSLGREMSKWTWFWVRDIVLCALVMGLVGSMMVRCTLNRKLEQMDEAKQYELWGRAVERKVAQQPPDRRKKFRAWLGDPWDATGK